jgi:predicted TIM-barrel fold metal-dependent hydrolase
MLFDFHVRIGPGTPPVDRLLSIMDSYGIARAGVAAGGLLDLDRLSAQILTGAHTDVDADNDGVLRACQAAADRLLPFYFANPRRGAGEYRDQADRFRGLELSPAVHGIGFDDPRTADLVAVAERAGHPVYVVCLGRSGTTAADLVALARRFPAVTFVFGHCGFIGIDAHGLTVVAPQPNILAETSGCFTVVARLAVARLGCERVLFGTEYPLQHPRVELAKFASLELADPSWQQIAWRNAHRVFGEEKP